MKQRTIKHMIRATGVGVHSGEKVLLTLSPAFPNTGIIFRRVDLPEPVCIPASVDYIHDTQLSTCLAKDGVKVSTVEHLLSALFGLGIDNLYVDVTGPEIPIMDGSAAPFVFLLQSAGVVEQSAPKKFLRIKKTVKVQSGDKFAKISPYKGFKVKFGLDFEHPLFDETNKMADIDFSHMSYAKEISRARTFGFLADYEAIRSRNLALGASLENAIVLDDFKVMNQDGLRYEDECVRHKILDVLGDLYLLQYPVLGAFTGYKSGHEMNSRLLNQLLVRRDAWDIVTVASGEPSPLTFPFADISPAAHSES